MKTPRRAWLIIGLLFLSGLLNYFDRQTLSIVKTTLRPILDLTDTRYSYLIAAFMVPYIIMYVLSGRMVDRFGSRICLTLFVAVWSLTTMASGLVQNLWQLGACRFVLGIAEPGGFPAAQRAMMIWFPPERRGFAFSLLQPCTAFGSILAPPVLAALVTHLSWRAAFVMPGAVGLVLAALWWRADRNAPEHVGEADQPEVGAVPLGEILRNRGLWGILVARLISDPLWYVYLFWLPSYFQEARGLSLAGVGSIAWIPPAVASVFGVAIGWYSDRAIRLGAPALPSRVRMLWLLSLAAPVGALTPFVPGIALAVGVVTIGWTVAQSWFFYQAVLFAELFPKNAAATALGICGAVGAGSGMLVNLGLGPLIERFGYMPVFVAGGLLHPIAAIVLRRVLLPGKGATGPECQKSPTGISTRP